MRKLVIPMLFLLLVGLNSCKKEINSIGLDLRDDLLGTEFVDTTTLRAYSLLEDSLNTTYTNTLLGELHDPIFGQTEAAIYMQLALEKTIAFTDNDIFDSIVLVLSYTGGYMGDTTQPVSIEVHKLSEDLNSTQTYYQFSTVTHESENLTHSTNFQTCYKPTTSFTVGTDQTKSAPHLRIRLTDNLKSDLMKNISSTNELRTTLKGLYIKANSTGNPGSMAYFRMNNDNSGLILYTHRADTTLTSQFRFYTKGTQEEVTYFTHFDHDYAQSTDPQFSQMVLSGDHTVGDKTLYLQSTGGIKTKIEFPHLADLFKEQNININRVIINRAELVITNMLPDEVYLKNPDNLTIKYIGTDGKLNALADENLGTSYFGGTYNKDKQEYRIRITRHVQSILKGVVKNNGFYLMPGSAAVSSTRLKFFGTKPDDLTKRLRLEISYTIY
jgi:hypothetical protein